MDSLFLLWFGVLVRLFRGRGKRVLENLALRQQLTVLKRRHPRPRLDLFDKLFWVIATQFWSTWKEALIVVTPETVVRSHRAGFRFYWRFTVPTITFGFLYCFFVIGHDRRRILHFNVTNHPTSMWIVPQLREAFPFEPTPRFLVFDRDAKYGWRSRPPFDL
jgi:hypothetical protein